LRKRALYGATRQVLQFYVLNADPRSKPQREVQVSKRLFYVGFFLAGILATTVRCVATENSLAGSDNTRTTEASKTTTNAGVAVSASSVGSHSESDISYSWSSAYIPSDSWVYPAMLRLY